MDYPKTSEEELPGLYEIIEEWLSIIEETLRTHFPVKQSAEGIEVLDFTDATAEDWVHAIDDNREQMTSWAQKMTGYSDRELDRQHGIKNAGAKFGGRKTSITDLDEAHAFGEILTEEIPDTLTLETCLFTWVKMYENDQRRFVRMDYENTVLEELQERGYPARKGEDVSGQPDIVIPRHEPFEVTGEVRVFHEKDKLKRYKEFRDEAREAERKIPSARFIVVANPGDYVTRNDREELRSEITSNEIDGVYFHDEIDDLIADLEEWGVTRQRTLDQRSDRSVDSYSTK